MKNEEFPELIEEKQPAKPPSESAAEMMQKLSEMAERVGQPMEYPKPPKMQIEYVTGETIDEMQQKVNRLLATENAQLASDFKSVPEIRCFVQPVAIFIEDSPGSQT